VYEVGYSKSVLYFRNRFRSW